MFCSSQLKEWQCRPIKIKARVEYINAHFISDYLKSGTSVILTGTHHCNWEWSAITVASAIEGGEVVGVYKRLSNQHLERFVKEQRAGMGMTLLEMKSTLQALEARKSKPAVYVLMADQWPSNPSRAHWATFVGRETACLPGVGFISKKYGFPVIYYTMQRVSRGRYTITFSELIGPDTQLSESEITAFNQAQMTQQVLSDAANWLWTHKRWKRSRVEVEMKP